MLVLSSSQFDPGRTSSNQRQELEPRSARNSLRRLGQAVGKELSHARPVMLGKYKYLGHQFAPTTDPDLVKDRPLTLSVCCLFGDSILPVFKKPIRSAEHVTVGFVCDLE